MAINIFLIIFRDQTIVEIENYDGVKLSSLHGRCQIVLFCMIVSNCPILHDGVKLSAVSNSPRCQIVLFAFIVSNCPKCQIVLGVKLSAVSNGPRIAISHRSRGFMTNEEY